MDKINSLQQISTRVAFLIAGFGIAAWAPLVPYAKIALVLMRVLWDFFCCVWVPDLLLPCLSLVHLQRALVAV
jgi:hypothetical protein